MKPGRKIRVQGEQGETGNRTIWGEVAVYNRSWAACKRGLSGEDLCEGTRLGGGVGGAWGI